MMGFVGVSMLGDGTGRNAGVRARRQTQGS